MARSLVLALVCWCAASAGAQAQSTEKSELWRERAVLLRQWRAELATLPADLRRWSERARARRTKERTGTQRR